MTKFIDDLPQNVKEIAKRENLTAEAVVTTSKTSLLIKGCSEYDIKVLKEAAAKIVACETQSVNNLLKTPQSLKWSRISFGCTGIDRCTGGGVTTRGITEICGISGAGKTQLLLQLSLMVQLPIHLGGLNKGVAFICTEDVFPTKRLFHLAKIFEQRHPKLDINYLRNVHIEHVFECDELLNCVTERLEKLLSNESIGLIVVDSVAALFRLRTDYICRAKDMRRFANALLKCCEKYNCAIVCVNQVASSKEIPCLGLSWAYLGRTRIKLSKIPKQIYYPTTGIKSNRELLTVRKFEIMFSPETPNDFSEFLITSEGIINVPMH